MNSVFFTSLILSIFQTSVYAFQLNTDAFHQKLVKRNETPSSTSLSASRRSFISTSVNSALLGLVGTSIRNPLPANAAGKTDLIADLEASREKLDKIPDLLSAGEWDSVRSILKTPPLNKLWNLGESQNTLVQLAKETGEFELLELKDELAISLQMCDQLTYDNAFVYFQPGNGKVKIKEPTDLAKKAQAQIQEAINTVPN